MARSLPKVVGVTVAGLLLLSASALAGGTVDAVVLVARVEDRFGQDCEIPVSGICMFRAENVDSPGATYLDTYQEIQYVGVATDFSAVREELGDSAWLLPDRQVTQDMSQIHVEHPVFTTLVWAWGKHGQAVGPVRLFVSDNNISAGYPVINRTQPVGPLKPHYLEIFSYAREGDGYLEYKRIGPFNYPGDSTTDMTFHVLPAFCKDTEPCVTYARTIDDTGRNSTPEIYFGWGVGEAQFATDPSNLTPPQPEPSLGIQASASGWRPDKPLDDLLENRTFAPGGASVPALPSPWMPPRASPPPSMQPEANPVALQSLEDAPAGESGPTALLVGAAAAAAAAALLAALGFGLYSRFISRDDVLASETRTRLLALIEAQPGVSLPELVGALGLARNTVRHHLQVMARLKLVRMGEDGGRLVVFAAAARPKGLPVWIRRNAVCMAILEAVRARPEGLTREEVHALLAEVPARTRNYHLKRLLGSGALVLVDRPSGKKALGIPPEGGVGAFAG